MGKYLALVIIAIVAAVAAFAVFSPGVFLLTAGAIVIAAGLATYYLSQAKGG